MKVYTVDLYEYYHVKKDDGAVGELTCYLGDKSREIDFNRKSPAMLVIPGGGYAMVSFREAEPIALKYLSYGFQAFVLNYSVAPLRFPHQLAESVMAMNYLREHSEELGIDPDKISAVGFSAGGHLCATLGSVNNERAYESIFKPKFEVRPNAVILGYPVITSGANAHQGSFFNLCGEENKDLIKKCDVLNIVDKNSAPAFIWATYSDACVPAVNAMEIARAYYSNGVPCSLHIWGLGAHGLSLGDITVYPNYDTISTASKSVSDWIRFSIEWLNERDLYI